MRTSLALLLFFTAFVSLSEVYASTGCAQTQDIFEPSGGMPYGKFKGKCLRSSGGERSQRTYVIATDYQLQTIGYPYPRQADHAVIANISHNDGFVIASLPLKSLERVVFQLERFPPEIIAAHTQLRFDFNESIPLFDQTNPSLKVGETKSMVFSVEAIPQREGPGYDLIKGVMNYYGLVFRLTTLEQKVSDVVIKEQNKVEQFALALNKTEVQVLFTNILLRHHKPQFSGEILATYHTITRNCTNILFENLDILTSKRRGFYEKIMTTLPVLSQKALVERHFIPTKTANMPTLNEEMGYPLRKK